MYMKGEEDKLSREERLLREAQWERQRREEEAVRMAAEMRRRRMLAEENRQKQTRKVHCHFYVLAVVWKIYMYEA